MPLSEDEQRILRQIEQDLRSDPGFQPQEERVSPARLGWLGFAIAVGTVALIGSLTVHPLLAFALFVVVLWLGLRFQREASSVAKDRLTDGSVNEWLSGARRQRPDDDAL